MPKITAIQTQVKTKGRYSVFVDEKFTFGISELGLINSGIRVGLEITENQLTELKAQAETDKIYNRLLDLVMRRPRSEWEIRDYLKRKKVEGEEVEELLNMLSNSGFVDDEDFAKRWVQNRRLLKSTSKRKLQLELRQKRVADEIINKVLVEDETDEHEVLKELIDRKRTQTRYQDNTKLMQYLIRQGFNYQDIKEVLSEN